MPPDCARFSEDWVQSIVIAPAAPATYTCPTVDGLDPDLIATRMAGEQACQGVRSDEGTRWTTLFSGSKPRLAHGRSSVAAWERISQ